MTVVLTYWCYDGIFSKTDPGLQERDNYRERFRKYRNTGRRATECSLSNVELRTIYNVVCVFTLNELCKSSFYSLYTCAHICRANAFQLFPQIHSDTAQLK